MTDPTPASPLPQSDALAEASPTSLAELFARDPEGLSEPDLDRIIAELRAHRERLARADAAPKPPRSRAVAMSAKAGANAEELGL
jgi:hypothetical protein